MSGLWLWLLMTFSVVLGSYEPCAYEICQCPSWYTVDCSRHNLTSLPPLSNASFTQARLDISYNNISHIQAGQLPPRLQSLVCQHTTVTSIDTDALTESTTTLTNLDISYSRLARLPWEMMKLPVLTHLYFTHNPMSTLGLPSWLTLHEDYSLSELELIDLSYNAIENIDDFVFFRLSKKLKSLCLLKNKIDNIDVLFYFDNIEKLDLSYNKICDSSRLYAPLFPHRHSLNRLDLDNNCWTQIPDLSHLTSLQDLLLQHNQIVDQTSLHLPRSLQTLYLSINQLTRVPHDICSLTNLTWLFLGDNNIQSLDSVTFPSSLKHLDLYNNNIENITTINFSHRQSNLTDLKLGDNPITHISPDAFNQIPKLTSLQLFRTKLTRLPLALHSLIQLNNLHLRDVPTLVCTCEEGSLASWYNNLTSPDRFWGDCDGKRVDYFLSHLAANCPHT